MDGELLAIDTAPDAFRRLWITPAGCGYDYTACPVTVSGGIAYVADRSGNVAAVREDGTPLWCVKCCNSAANFITEAPDGSLWATFDRREDLSPASLRTHPQGAKENAVITRIYGFFS